MFFLSLSFLFNVYPLFFLYHPCFRSYLSLSAVPLHFYFLFRSSSMSLFLLLPRFLVDFTNCNTYKRFTPFRHPLFYACQQSHTARELMHIHSDARNKDGSCSNTRTETQTAVATFKRVQVDFKEYMHVTLQNVLSIDNWYQKTCIITISQCKTLILITSMACMSINFSLLLTSIICIYVDYKEN